MPWHANWKTGIATASFNHHFASIFKKKVKPPSGGFLFFPNFQLENWHCYAFGREMNLKKKGGFYEKVI
jgi:hypothetical protein